MLEQHEPGPVPGRKPGPDVPGALGDRVGGAGFGDEGQMAGLSSGCQPDAQMRDTFPARGAQRVLPERLVGDADVRASTAGYFP
jgi:hypothetical protein